MYNSKIYEQSSNILFDILLKQLKNFYIDYGKLAESPNIKNLTAEIINILKVILPEKEELSAIIASLSKEQNNVKFLAQFKESPLFTAKDMIHDAIKPSDSCGNLSLQVSSIILGTEIANQIIFQSDSNAQSNKERGFKKITELEVEEIATIKSPHLIRIDIERLDSNKWTSSHSYLILTNQSHQCHVFQAYVMSYTLAEWLKDSRNETLARTFLEDHFESLKQLHSEDEEDSKLRQIERGQIYSLLYRKTGEDIPSKNYPMRINYVIQKFDPKIALQNIKNLEQVILLNSEKLDNTTDNLEDILLKSIISDVVEDNSLSASFFNLLKRYEDVQKQAESAPHTFYSW